eukprot:1986596-Rhodomonas_salina.1
MIEAPPLRFSSFEGTAEASQMPIALSSLANRIDASLEGLPPAKKILPRTFPARHWFKIAVSLSTVRGHETTGLKIWHFP